MSINARDASMIGMGGGGWGWMNGVAGDRRDQYTSLGYGGMNGWVSTWIRARERRWV